MHGFKIKQRVQNVRQSAGLIFPFWTTLQTKDDTSHICCRRSWKAVQVAVISFR